jgi:Type III restriction enzyme, res subunit
MSKANDPLVLNQWMLTLFGRPSFEQLVGDEMARPEREGYDGDNVSFFFHYLDGLPRRDSSLTRDALLRYDGNIYRYWKAVTNRRTREAGHPIQLKYFQYLALLFTEIYLDRLFSDREALRQALNSAVHAFNVGKDDGDRLDPYTTEQLHKLALWQATGSGKTLVMHVNIMQYQHYLDQHGRGDDLNRIILLTPNEGLSLQHLQEFRASGIGAVLFTKDARSLFSGRQIEIIDINKLRDEEGDKTVAIDAFESNNLVLVDEGHRGSSGEEWKAKRDRLCERGFSFEYSATFKQAMEAANKPELTREYAKCILFDYSYKYFYADGYGKDYHILNIGGSVQEEIRQRYLTACLLGFYQQVRLYRDRREDFRSYLLAAPLLVFVGSSVTKAASAKDVSDVVDILLFLADIASEAGRERAVERIALLLTGQAALRDDDNEELFANAFTYLNYLGLTAASIYDDIVRIVFRADAPGVLSLRPLTRTEGEVALNLGLGAPFGVINVGDAASLIKACKSYEALRVEPSDFGRSLFGAIDGDESPVTVLIGAKKFTEGWSSWRVSTMGLMNVGRSEGSQIIQLFGRGVRLRGFGFSLKRSRKVQEEQGVAPPQRIETLETLYIFGIRADYMQKFREYLEGEGLPPNTRFEEIILPTARLGSVPRLKTIRVKPGIDFKHQAPRLTLERVAGSVAPAPVSVDWYPKIESQKSSEIQHDGSAAAKYIGTLQPGHLAFMDIDDIFFELVRFKSERGWHNLTVTREGIVALLLEQDWYKLSIPPETLAFTGFGQAQIWQELAIVALKKYCEVFYKHKKSAYEQPFLEYGEIDITSDQNMVSEYRFTIAPSESTIIECLKRLKQDIVDGTLNDLQVNGLQAFRFGHHLYEPLIYLKNSQVKVSPVALNEGERDFVLDLKKFCEREPVYFRDRSLYLLRNKSRVGLGFFEAGNFYPDFILWLVAGARQHIAFLDPKGMRNLLGIDDPKITFYKTIKSLEARLGDPGVTLDSFIIANTPFGEVSHWQYAGDVVTRALFEEHHVFFQKDDRSTYIRNIMHCILPPPVV